MTEQRPRDTISCQGAARLEDDARRPLVRGGGREESERRRTRISGVSSIQGELRHRCRRRPV